MTSVGPFLGGLRLEEAQHPPADALSPHVRSHRHAAHAGFTTLDHHHAARADCRAVHVRERLASRFVELVALQLRRYALLLHEHLPPQGVERLQVFR